MEATARRVITYILCANVVYTILTAEHRGCRYKGYTLNSLQSTVYTINYAYLKYKHNYINNHN